MKTINLITDSTLETGLEQIRQKIVAWTNRIKAYFPSVTDVKSIEKELGGTLADINTELVEKGSTQADDFSEVAEKIRDIQTGGGKVKMKWTKTSLTLPICLPYSNTETYAVNEYATHEQKIYKCIAAASQEEFDSNKWEEQNTPWIVNSGGYICGFRMIEQQEFDDFKIDMHAATITPIENAYIYIYLDNLTVVNAWRALQAVTSIVRKSIALNRFDQYFQPILIYGAETNSSASFRTLASPWQGTGTIKRLPKEHFNELKVQMDCNITSNISIDVYIGREGAEE